MPFLQMPKGTILAPSEHTHRTGAVQALLDLPVMQRNSLLRLYGESPRAAWATLTVMRAHQETLRKRTPL